MAFGVALGMLVVAPKKVVEIADGTGLMVAHGNLEVREVPHSATGPYCQPASLT